MTAADLTTSASAERVAIHVDDVRVEVLAGASLAAALLDLRIGDRGLPAPTNCAPTWPPICAPICAMGSCFGCLVRVDGREQVRACTERCRAGMRVHTHARTPR